jgi:hypothetical protein
LNRRETAQRTAKQILATDLDRRGALMLKEDGPVGLADWRTCGDMTQGAPATYEIGTIRLVVSGGFWHA